ARAAVEGVGTRRGFGKSIRADDLTRSKTRQVLLLLLFSSEVHDGEQADAGVSAPGRGEAGVFGNMVADDGGSHLVHFHAAVGFRHVDRAESQLAGLFQQLTRNREVFVLDLLDIGNDFILREVFRCLGDKLVLLVEVFGRKDFAGLALFQQEAGAGNSGFGYCSRSHDTPSLTTKDTKVSYFQFVPLTNRLIPSFR